MAVTGRTLALQRELRTQLNRILDQQLRDLTAAWVRAWDEVSLDLRDAIVDALTSEKVTRGNLLRIERLRRSLAVVADQLEDLADQARVRILTDLRDVLDAAGGAQASIIDSQLPAPTATSTLVDFTSWARVDRRQLDAMVRRTTQRITSQTRPLGKQVDDVVRRELVRGMAAGSNPRAVARTMLRRAERGFNGGLTRALTISRTELVDAHRAAAALGQAQHTDVLSGWMWLSTLSTRTCSSCLGMHGSTHPLNEVGPLDHQQGRCSRMPVTKPWSELGFDVAEPPSLVRNADDWFDALTRAEQRSILGPERYAAWAAGNFPRSSWATRRTSSGWRDSYVPAKPPKTGPTGGQPPKLPPELPVSAWDNERPLPQITDDDLDKVLDGVQQGSRWSGGHSPGLGLPGKTEYPAGGPWDSREFLRSAIELTMRSAHWRDLKGDRHVAWRLIEGLLHEVSWYYQADGRPTFRAAFPVNGPGVIYNHPVDGPELRPLDLSAIGVEWPP